MEKKSAFSMSKTWINAVMTLKSPSREAFEIISKIDSKKKECDFIDQIRDFLEVESPGYHENYLNATDSKTKNKCLQEVMHSFQYTIELSIGPNDIKNKVAT